MSDPQTYLVQSSTPPVAVPEGWTRRDYRGSYLLIKLAWLGVIVGALVSLVGLRWAALGGAYGGGADWLAQAAAAAGVGSAAILALFLWPFFRQRQNIAAAITLAIGLLALAWTIYGAGSYLVYKERLPAHDITTASEADLLRELRSLNEADDRGRRACRVRREVADAWECFWHWASGGNRARLIQIDEEMMSRQDHRWRAPVARDLPGDELARAYLTATIVLLIGGAVVVSGAQGLKVMYSEPGAGPVVPKPIAPPVPIAEPDIVQATFAAWVKQCLQASADAEPTADLLYRHHCAFSDWTGGRAYSSPETFGAAMSGPIAKFSGVRIKTGKDGLTCYRGLELVSEGLSGKILAKIGS